jgi:two-component system, NarL family, response regulator NreC
LLVKHQRDPKPIKGSRSIRILVADDHQIVREGLRKLLETEQDMEVVGEAEDGRAALELARKLIPDVVVMDVKMPKMTGIDASRQIHAESPGTKIIALSIYEDLRFVTNMFRAGAKGYLLKECAFEELAQAVRSVMANRTYLSPQVADNVLQDYISQSDGPKPSAYSALTSREREILKLLSEGKRSRQIANLLDISVKTADTHRLHIMRKLGLKNMVDLTKFAIREGLTTPER